MPSETRPSRLPPALLLMAWATMANTPVFAHQAPAYPRRHPSAIAAVTKLVAEDEGWTRLEGAPELEQQLQQHHGQDPAGRDPIVWYLSSGTAALQAIMLGHGIGPGDEVVTTAYTWAATTTAILAIGAIPVFADITLENGLLDAAEVEKQISPHTKAIMAVHLFGHPVDCQALRTLADQHQILFLEDASQAHGARFADKQVGDWGHASAFSCMGLKLLAGTEGGYAVFRDPAAAEAAYLYGKHPRGLPDAQAKRLTDAGLLDALQLGWRPCSVGATLLQHALPHLAAENASRRANAASLRTALQTCEAITMPQELPQAEGCYHLLSLLYDETKGQYPRDEFLQRLQQVQVPYFIYIPTPIHRLRRLNAFAEDAPPAFWHAQLRQASMDYRAISLPATEQRCEQSFELAFNWIDPAEEAMHDLAAAIQWAAQGAAP